MRSGRDLYEPQLGLTLPLAGLHFIFYFLVQADQERAYGLFGFHPETAFSHPWSFFTYQFLHGDLMSLFFGAMIFYQLGMVLEAEWGFGEYAVFWLVATLGGSVAGWILGTSLLSGMLLVNVSMLFAYAYLFPDTVFYIYFILPMKVKWLAYITLAVLAILFVLDVLRGQLLRGIVDLCGVSAGFLYFWIRQKGQFHARKVAKRALSSVKEAGAVRQDQALEQRNRTLFPKVEALREAARAGAELPASSKGFAEELATLVVPGVKICKPVDFKGDRDGVCVRCEGFAECSLRYVAGQPGEIVVKAREP